MRSLIGSSRATAAKYCVEWVVSKSVRSCVAMVTSLAVSFGVSGCSTIDVRGNTQSVAMSENSHLYGPRNDTRDGSSASSSRSKSTASGQRGDGGRAQQGIGAPKRTLGATPAGGGTVKYYRNEAPSRAPAWNEAAAPARDDSGARAIPPARGGRSDAMEWQRHANVAPVRSSPKEELARGPDYVRSGWARWMGKSWTGHRTASGEMFDPARLTAAHSSLPIPSFLYVTNQKNGRTILVRINDRTPSSGDHVIVLSRLAADLLDFREAGRVKVDLQYAGPAATEPNMKHEEAFLLGQPWFHRDMLHGSSRVSGAGAPNRQTRRFPTPTYPRWDGTQRNR